MTGPVHSSIPNQKPEEGSKPAGYVGHANPLPATKKHGDDKASSHTERLQNQSEGEGGDLVQGVSIIGELLEEQKQLQHQIELMNHAAQELEKDGDDVARLEAQKLVQKSSEASKVERDLSVLIGDIQADPHKKVSRKMLKPLQAAVSSAISGGEAEVESAHTIHQISGEHRDHMQSHLLQASQKKSEKKQTKYKPKKKEPKAQPKEASHHKHADDEEDDKKPSLVHRTVETVKSIGHRIWNKTKSVAESVVETVRHSTPYVVAAKCAHAVVDFTVSIPERVEHLYESAKEKAYHAYIVGAEMAGSAMQSVRNAGSAAVNYVSSLFGFGDDEPEKKTSAPPPTLALHQAPQLNHQAVSALKGLKLPILVATNDNHEHGTLPSPVTPPGLARPQHLAHS